MSGFNDIRDAALRYLAYRDHTIFEMRSHLHEKEYPEVEIEEVILNLLELKYLDDYSYARKYIPYAAKKGKGKGRIKIELSQKGIASQIINKAIADECEPGEILGISEFERALIQAEKSIGSSDITEKAISKAGRRLITLGYSSDVVYKVVGIIMKRNKCVDDD